MTSETFGLCASSPSQTEPAPQLTLPLADVGVIYIQKGIELLVYEFDDGTGQSGWFSVVIAMLFALTVYFTERSGTLHFGRASLFSQRVVPDLCSADSLLPYSLLVPQVPRRLCFRRRRHSLHRLRPHVRPCLPLALRLPPRSAGTDGRRRRRRCSPGYIKDADIQFLPIGSTFNPTLECVPVSSRASSGLQQLTRDTPCSRDWVVPFWSLPVKWVFVALPFGCLVTLLFYFDVRPLPSHLPRSARS